MGVRAIRLSKKERNQEDPWKEKMSPEILAGKNYLYALKQKNLLMKMLQLMKKELLIEMDQAKKNLLPGMVFHIRCLLKVIKIFYLENILLIML